MSLYKEHLKAIKESAIGNSVDEVTEEVKRNGRSITIGDVRHG